MRFVTLACCLLCITGVVSTSSSASGQTATPAARSYAVVKIAGDSRDVAAMTAVLRERMGNAETDGPIDAVAKVDRNEVLAPTSEPGSELARIWIDLAEEPLVVYVVDGAGQRVLVRTISRGENLEVAREEIGHIVEAALVALRAGERIGVERTELVEAKPDATPPAPVTAPRDSAPPPVVPPPPAPRWLFDGSLFYGMRAYGNGPELATGPGIAIGFVRRSRRLSAGARVFGEYRFPAVVAGEAASVRFESFSLSVLATAELALDASRKSTVELGLGPGLDIVDAEGRNAASATATLANEKTRADPFVRTLARYGFATPIFRVFAGVGVDVPMSNPSYVLLQRSERVVLFAPWVVRPFLVVGIETN